MKSNRTRFAGIVLIVLGIAAAIFFKPVDSGAPHAPYFAALNQELRGRGMSRPCIVLDLDRLDQNIAQVRHHLRPPLTYRIVTKSLPSLELIDYVMKKTGSSSLMAFHAPYVRILAERFPRTDILTGKPLLAGSVERIFDETDPDRRALLARQVQWLVDTRQRLARYLDLAKAKDTRLRINLEIDVGLHRGGARSHAELDAMLALIEENPRHLAFSGFMGYEAHVPHAPPVISSPDRAFASAMKTYADFVSFGSGRHPGLFRGQLTFNSGGSKTYQRFTPDLAANDVAAGSCMVKPSTFGILDSHVPALYIAAPVLKKLPGPQVPFIEAVSGLLTWWDPLLTEALYIYGGGWAADIVSPAGVKINALTADPPNQNLLPNQSLYNGSAKTRLAVGDFVFFWPHQADAMSQFEEILVVRGGKIVDRWKPFPQRY